MIYKNIKIRILNGLKKEKEEVLKDINEAVEIKNGFNCYENILNTAGFKTIMRRNAKDSAYYYFEK